MIHYQEYYIIHDHHYIIFDNYTSYIQNKFNFQ
jgi:hypothetical protein